MGKLRTLWQQNRLLLSAFVISVAVMLFFAVRFVLFFVYWHDPRHQNQPIEPWMTVRYVAHSWHVKPEALEKRLGIGPPPNPDGGPKPLDKIAHNRGIPFPEFKKQVDEAVQQLLKEHPPK